MVRIASSALAVVAGGAVLLLHGCGGGSGPEVSIMATQVCDNQCEVQIACRSGQCRRIPGANCLHQEEGDCFHHETCQEFMDETAKQRQCDTMAACCLFNSVLTGPDKVVDPVCSIAYDEICSDAHPEPELLAKQLCDNECQVRFTCEDGTCRRHPSADCLNTDPTDCSPHESCQEFRDDDNATTRECNMMGACCAFNSVLSGPDKVVDPICSLSIHEVCDGHPSAEADVAVTVV